MSATGQIEAEESSHQRGSSVCQPLRDAATQDLFRNNAFRITGLPVDATTREVSKQAEKIKIFAELRQDAPIGAAFRIKPPPTLDEIREAIQKLKDPEKRLIDEFFWFWPEEFGQNQSDPAIQALAKGDSKTAIEIWKSKENSVTDGVVASHNMALVYHINALDWENYSVKKEVDAERRQKINGYWKQSFKRWERLATDELFWEKVVARIRQLDEPNLPTGFARRMRATLPEALDKINAELAVAFVKSSKIEIARLHIGFLRGPEQRQDKVDKIGELVLTPVSNRLKEQIKSARDLGEKTPPKAAKVALELLQQSRQTLSLFDLFFGKDNELRNDLFDEVALACNRLQFIYHEATKDEKTCLEILNSVLPLTTAIELRQQIEKNIGTLTGFVADNKLEPVYALLKSLQDSKDSPKKKLDRFKREIMPVIMQMISLITNPKGPLPRHRPDRPIKMRWTCTGKTPPEDKAFTELLDSIAIVLRGISLDAWNKNHDRKTAIAGNELALAFACDPPLDKKLMEDKLTLTKFSNPFGDAGGEHTRMHRGKYDSMIYVALAFVAQIVCSGILVLSFISNILKTSCDDATSWIIGGLAGAGIALLVFWNRWKCIEAFSSQASCGIVNISMLYVPIVALMYANWRWVKKIFDRREWENTGANKSSRLALAGSAIVLLFGIAGECTDGTASNSTANMLPAHNFPSPQTPTVYSPPAPAASTLNQTTVPPWVKYQNHAEPTYKVPNSVSAELARDSAAIDLEKAKALKLNKQLEAYNRSYESEKAQADALQSELESLGSEIESDRTTLDRESQSELDDFNDKVNRYNALLQDVRLANANVNQWADAYNSLLEQVRAQNRLVNQLVDSYNAKLQQSGR